MANPVLFFRANGPYGCFSQWANAPMTDGEQLFQNTEQYMMYQKALLFGDRDTAAQIMTTHNPAMIKKLGRQVRGFDEARWAEHRYRIVLEGNLHKFRTSVVGQHELLGTGDRPIGEASPYDTIWGIGLEMANPRAQNPALWTGQNLLGKALMEVRTQLRAEAAE